MEAEVPNHEARNSNRKCIGSGKEPMSRRTCQMGCAGGYWFKFTLVAEEDTTAGPAEHGEV